MRKGAGAWCWGIPAAGHGGLFENGRYHIRNMSPRMAVEKALLSGARSRVARCAGRLNSPEVGSVADVAGVGRGAGFQWSAGLPGGCGGCGGYGDGCAMSGCRGGKAECGRNLLCEGSWNATGWQRRIKRRWRGFERLGEVKQEHGVEPDDIWNADQKGFQVGNTSNYRQVVYTRATRHFANKPGSGKGTWVTLNEAISANGRTIPSYYILKGESVTITGVPDTVEDDAQLALGKKPTRTTSCVWVGSDISISMRSPWHTDAYVSSLWMICRTIARKSFTRTARRMA